MVVMVWYYLVLMKMYLVLVGWIVVCMWVLLVDWLMKMMCMFFIEFGDMFLNMVWIMLVILFEVDELKVSMLFGCMLWVMVWVVFLVWCLYLVWKFGFDFGER